MKTKTVLRTIYWAGIFLLVQNTYAQFDGGTGTPEDPYLISTAEQLNSIRNSPNENRSYKLTADIDLGAWIAANPDQDIQDNGWLPVDVTRKIFDGDGHKIIGFWYNRTSGDGQGLFHQVNVEMSDNEYGNDAVIKNLTIEIDNIRKVKGNSNTAALIGIVNGNEDSPIPVKIINCRVIGDIESNGTAGGLVGRAGAPLELTGCSFSGTISVSNEWDARVGGLIGHKYEGRASLLVSECFITNGSVTGRHSNTGGIAGEIGPNSTIENCYADETTSITSLGIAGGLVGNWGGKAGAGNFRFASTMKNCYSKATITGDQNIGGLAGIIEARYGTLHEDAEERALAFDIIDCYVEGELQGSSDIGGLAGRYVSDGGLIIDGSVIDNCHTKVNITSHYGEIGGLVGNSEGCKNLELKNSSAEITNTVQFGGSVGGLAGTFGASEADGSSLFNCHATGSIQGGETGGLVARYRSAGSVRNCYSTVGISGNTIGGIIASINNTGDYPVHILNCYRTGDIGGDMAAYVGGLIGAFDSGSGSIIDSCHVLGNVCNSWDAAGGLVGTAANSKNLTISNSYYIGNIPGGSFSGGLAGIFGAGGTDESAIRNSYVLGNITGTHAGGLAGRYQSTGPVEKTFAAGNITGGYWGDDVSGGGLIGDVPYPFTLSQSYAEGTQIGQHNQGGLVGRYLAGSGGSVIENCYTLNGITGEYDANGIGGLTGNIAVEGSNVIARNSFALNPSITTYGSKGVLAGSGDSKLTATNCYAFIGLNTIPANTAVATFIDKAAICSKAAYEAGNWDFDNIWTWGNDYYRLPVLKDLDGQPAVQPEHLPLSGNAALSSLALSKGTLTPGFDPGTFSYSAEVLHAVENITVTAAASGEDNATVTGDGKKALEPGNNTFTIHVAAEDQVTTAGYTITVHRITALADAALSALSVSEGTLTPAFAPETEQYTVQVDFPVESIEITATANSANATLTGDGPQTLAVGENTFTIEVTAEDGISVKNYIIEVIRARGTSVNAPNKDIRIYTHAQSITVKGATGIITLTDSAGVSQKFTARGTQTHIPVPGKGVYMLTINKTTYKILVK